MSKQTVVLIAMPWQSIFRPSLQLGILQPILEREGIPVQVRSFYLAAAEYFFDKTADLPGADRITAADHDLIANNYTRLGLAEWIFTVPPYREPSGALDEAYFAYLRSENVPQAAIDKAVGMRRLVPAFLQACVEDILAASPAVVGFTTAFNQNVPSLVLSKLLKSRDPSVRIVFGGGSCDAAMGAALHRSFPWVDVVVRGEGELVLPPLVRDLLAGTPIQRQSGLCFWEDGRNVVVEEAPGPVVAMDDSPLPNYDEYFERVRRSRMRADLAPHIMVPFEGSRGCWWGEKSHCTFCGLVGATMAFRSKSAPRVGREIFALAAKYKQIDFEAVDNILDMEYLAELMPQLREFRDSGFDFKIFYETKSNLKKSQLRLLRDAGIQHIQPGIESLSTPILKLMRKGVTALQNIRLLKWMSQFRMRATWNLLYGFPGEPPEEYEKMARLMQSLTHLQPPNLSSLVVERFSPYHQDPRRFGLSLDGPFLSYGFLYDLDEATLNDIAFDFKHRYSDGRDPASYIQPVKEVIEVWRQGYRPETNSLQYRSGPGFLVINDRRPNLEAHDYHFGEVEASIYLGCAGGARAWQIRGALGPGGAAGLTVDHVKAFLDRLVEARLMYEEDGRYLALALPANENSEDGVSDVAERAEPLAELVQIGR